jgi:hypothetical protein
MNTEEHQEILNGEGAYQSFTERRFGLTTTKFIAVSATVITIFLYLGLLIFGDNSLSVLLSLEERQDFLTHDIEHLKGENAALQKQYFELKEIDADSATVQKEKQP